jgi:hypothetical protein
MEIITTNFVLPEYRITCNYPKNVTVDLFYFTAAGVYLYMFHKGATPSFQSPHATMQPCINALMQSLMTNDSSSQLPQ